MDIFGSTDPKQMPRMVEIIDDLESCWSSVPDKMRETRDVFRKQFTKENSQ